MRNNVKTISTVLILAVLALLVPAPVFAVGTAANTAVNNTADLKYSVGGGAPITITNTASFTVDRKVNFTVTNLVSSFAQPGVNDVVLSFFVNNAGNDAQSFMLDYWSDNADTLEMDDVRVYIDNGAIANALDGTDVAYTAGSGARAFNLSADAGIRVIIVANTPIAAIDGNAANYWLIANATDNGTNTLVVNTAGANTAGVDTVVADGANGYSDTVPTADVAYNNAYSDMGTYTVSSAIVDFSKLFNSVAWDPVNYNNGNQKAIPGAYVRYELTITNDALASASAIIANIEDSLPTSVTLVPYLDDFSTPATPVSTTGNEFIVTCSVPTDTRACETPPGTSHNPDSNVAGVYLLNLLTALPSEGAGPLAAGEVAPGDVITIMYMVLIQ